MMPKPTGLIMALAALAGGGSLLLFSVFLFFGPPDLVKMGWSESVARTWDAALSFMFFGQHSGMLRKGFRARLGGLVPPHYHGALYAIVSGVALTIVVGLWQESSIWVHRFEGFPRLLMRGLFLLAMGGFAWGISTLRSFDPLGLASIGAHLHGKAPGQHEFVVRGPYRWVRHPLYCFSIVLIWSCPDVTADRLLFNLLWTLWIYFGTFLEEADLVAEFGDAYRDFQRNVPRLFPWRLPRS
jgi:methanethiol S-methyltransferase